MGLGDARLPSSMRREQRLRRRRDFASAYRRGRVQSNALLVVRIHPNGGELTRWGFVAGKVVGGAVVRNRVKRRLREAARSLDVTAGLDIVVGVRKPASGANYALLRDAMVTLLERHRALRAPSPPVATQENS